MRFLAFGKKPTPSERKSQIPTGVVGLHTQSRPAWSARHPSALARNGFLQNPIAFRSVRLIAEAAATLKLNLQDGQMRYDTHPVLDLLHKPNESVGQSEFFETLYGHYLLFGQAFIEAKLDEEQNVQTLYLLRPDRVRIRLGRDGWPVGYDYKVANHKQFYPIQEGFSTILQIKSFHPLDDHYGLSPINAAGDAIDVHNAAGAWSKALLDNAARPSGAIIYRGVDGNGHLSEAQYNRLTDELESHHQGARNAGRPMLLEGGLDWKPMGFSPNDMEFHRTKDMAAREIALAFGVPPMLLGIPGDNTYSNYQEANRAFYRLSVLPLVERVISSLNIWLLDQSETNLHIDMESIPALAPEREANWRRISSANFLTESEKRKLLGFPEGEVESDAEEI